MYAENDVAKLVQFLWIKVAWESPGSLLTRKELFKAPQGPCRDFNSHWWVHIQELSLSPFSPGTTTWAACSRSPPSPPPPPRAQLPTLLLSPSRLFTSRPNLPACPFVKFPWLGFALGSLVLGRGTRPGRTQGCIQEGSTKASDTKHCAKTVLFPS